MNKPFTYEQQIEIVPIDWAMAFNSIAPLVTEARAFLVSGDTTSAKRSLDTACERIWSAGVTMLKYETPRPGNHHFVGGRCQCGQLTTDDPQECTMYHDLPSASPVTGAGR